MFDDETKDSRSAAAGSGSGFGDCYSLANPSIQAGEDIPQPVCFNGKLKGYQLKGMNWLANLYEQVGSTSRHWSDANPKEEGSQSQIPIPTSAHTQASAHTQNTHAFLDLTMFSVSVSVL